MSETIDDKVVEMRFDNHDFESNVATSMNTLGKLKQAVDMKGAAKGLESVADAANKLNMTPLNQSVINTSDGFSVLEGVALGAFMRIGQGAVDAGARILRALTVQPLIDGFREYEMTMNSVKTIKSNLPNESMDSINSTLAALNKYADDTIYNFSDMTRAIGQFTAAGVDLNSATLAIKGMSNVAAGAGANNQALARAEYQVSQALQSGVFHLMDWNSLVQSGMANPELQEQLKATARAHGVAVDDMIAKQGSFRDSLTEGWLTADIFTETMARAADTSNEWGARLTDAATQVNTFSQLVSVLAESVGSSFTNTWQLILGDYEQSKKIFTGLYNQLNPLIDGMGNFRNGILQTWADLGGRDYLFDGITKSIQGIIQLFTPLSDGFADLFGGSGSVLAQGSKAFDDLMTKFSDATSILVSDVQESTAPVQDAIQQLVGESGIQQIGGAMMYVHDSFTATFTDSMSSVANVVNSVTDAVGDVSDSVGSKLQPITDMFSNLGDTISKAFDGTTFHSEAINNLIAALTRQNESLTGAQRAALNFRETIGGLMSIIDIFGQALGVVNTALGRTIDVIMRLAGSAGKIIVAFTGGIGHLITTIDQLLTNGGVFGKATDAVNGFFDALNDPLNAIDAFADTTANVITTVFEVLANILSNYVAPALAEIGQLIAPVIGAIVQLGAALGSLVGSVLSRVPELFVAAANAIYDFFKSLNFNIDLSSFQGVLNTIGSFIQALGARLAPVLKTIMDKLSEFGRAVGGVLKSGFDALMQVLPGVVDWLGKFAGILGNAAFTGLSAIGSGILAFGQAIGSAFSGIVSSAGDAVTSGQLFTGAAAQFAKAVPVIANALTGLRNIIVAGAKAIGLSDFVNAIATGIANFDIGAIVTAAGRFILRIGQAIVNAITSFSLGDMIRGAFNNVIIPIFKSLGELLGEAASGIASGGSALIDGLKDAFDALTEGIVGALDAFLTGLNPAFEGGVKTFLDIVSGFFKGIFDGLGNIVKMVSGGGDFLQNTVEDMQQNGAFQSLIRLMDTISGVYLAKSISNATGAMETAAEMGKRLSKAVQKFASSINNISKAAKLFGLAAVFVAVAWAVKQIADAISELGSLDLGTLAQGGAAVAAIVGVVAGIAAAFMKLKQNLSIISTVAPEMNDNPVAKFILAIKQVVGAAKGVSTSMEVASVAGLIAAFGLVVKLLADTAVQLGQLDGDTLLKGVGTLLAIIGTVAAVYTGIMAVSSHFSKGSKSIFLMAAGIALIAGAFALISQTLEGNDLSTTEAALGIMLGAIGVLTAISIVISKFSGTGGSLAAGASVVMLCGSLILIAGAFKMLSDSISGMDSGTMDNTERILVELLGVLTVCDIAISKFAGGASGIAAAGAMVILAYALARVCDAINTIQDPDKAAQIIESVDGLLLVMGVVLAALSSLGGSALSSIAVAASLAIVMVAMGWLIQQIGDIEDPDGATSVLNALTILVGVMEALLIPFALLGPYSLAALAAAASVSLIMVAMGYLVQQIGQIDDPSGATSVLNALTLLVGVIEALLIPFAALGPLSLATLPAAASVMLIMYSLGQLVSAIGQIEDPSGASAVISSLTLLAVGITAALAVWAGVSMFIPGASAAAQSLGGLFNDIASAMDTGASAIDKTASAMSTLSPVLDQMRSLDTSAVDNLADVCTILGGIDLVGALAGFISGEDTIGNVCNGLATLAGTLDQWGAADYTTAADNMNAALKAVGSGLTNFGTVISGWSGSGDDIDGVLNGLAALSSGLESWGNSDIDFDAVSNNIRNVSSAAAFAATQFSDMGDSGSAIAVIAPQLQVLAAGASAWSEIDPNVGTTLMTVMQAIGVGLTAFSYGGDAIMNMPMIAAGLDSLVGALVDFAAVDPSIGESLATILGQLGWTLPTLASAGDSVYTLMTLGPALTMLADGCMSIVAADPASAANGLMLIIAATNSFGGVDAEGLGGAGMALTNIGYGCQILAGSAIEAANGLMVLTDVFGMIGMAAATAESMSSSAFGSMGAQAAAAASAVSAAMNSMAGMTASAMATMTGILQSSMSSIVGMAGSYGSQIATTFASGIRTGVGMASSAAAACVSAATAAFSNTGGSYSAGVNFAQGYRNGILSQVSSIAAAAAQMVTAAISAANSAQASASPSRVMKKVGRWYAQGYALGIKHDADMAATNAVNMVEATVRAANVATEHSDLLQPTIQPLLDTGSLQNRISTADLGLNTAFNVSATASNADVVNAVNGLRDNLTEYTNELKNSRMATINIDKEALNTHPDIESDVLNILEELSTLGAMNNG